MTQLFEIEREVARRCGPYLDDTVADSGLTWGSTSLSSLVLPTLQSTLDLGDEWTGRYILRRGLIVNSAGVVSLLPTSTPPASPIAPYLPTGPLASDRIRRVASVDYTTGTVTPDRPWTNYPASNEVIELHYLDPAKQLRVAALAGLDRCYIEDRVSLATTGQATERDLTALATWLTQTNQIKNIQWNYPTVFQNAMDVGWFDTFYQDGHVWAAVAVDPYPNNIVVTARRPISSLATESISYGAATSCGISHTTPEVVNTFAPHGLVTGNRVLVSGTTDQNGTWAVTVIDSTHFSLDGSIGDGTGGTVLGVYDQVFASDDLADYPVTLDYAAAAGLCAAWEKFPGLLIGGAQVGLVATQAMAAMTFSKQTDANYRPSERRTGFDSPFPSYSVQRV